MTREEAIELLEKEKAYMLGHGGDAQANALNMAIQALEQQNELFKMGLLKDCESCKAQSINFMGCDNVISREKAKQFLYERLDRLNNDELYDIFSRIIDDMYNELPSITPTTQWHKIKTRPLTEEEEDEMYLNDNYYTFMYDCKMPDDKQKVLVKTKWGIEITAYYTDDGCYFVGYDDEDDVIAWTELPKWEE